MVVQGSVTLTAGSNTSIYRMNQSLWSIWMRAHCYNAGANPMRLIEVLGDPTGPQTF
ncbi:MAG: hypothetical protein ACREDN_01010 [Aestuariivirga sp.]